MTKELNTLLTALYVLIDDHVVPSRTGRGRRPELSDSALLTLAVAQVLLGFSSERRWIRHVHSSPQWRAMFPHLPNQSGYHKRLKNAQVLLCQAIVTVAASCPSWFDDMWMTDAPRYPAPNRGIRSNAPTWPATRPTGTAHHSRHYRGFKLYLVCAGDGIPDHVVPGQPQARRTRGRDRAARPPPAPDPVRADPAGRHGLRRSGVQTGHRGIGLRLLRPDRKDETYRNGNLGGVRQWIESVNQTLKGQLDLEHHRGRTLTGVFTRIAQRLLAMTAGFWHNWTRNITSKRSLTAYDH